METTKTKMDACLSLVESAQNELESAKTSSEARERDRSERLDVARADLVGAEVTLTEVEMELRSLPEQIRDTENAIGKERENLRPKKSTTPSWLRFVERSLIYAPASALPKTSRRKRCNVLAHSR